MILSSEHNTQQLARTSTVVLAVLHCTSVPKQCKSTLYYNFFVKCQSFIYCIVDGSFMFSFTELNTLNLLSSKLFRCSVL